MRRKLIKLSLLVLVILGLIIPQSLLSSTAKQVLAQESQIIETQLVGSSSGAHPGLAMPGRIEGSGTSFEIKDSEYLNITLKSSQEIKVILESIPRMISLDIEASPTPSTLLTLTGLEPNKTYYKYEDSHKNETVFVSDSQGIYSWVQDLLQSHHIWIQEEKGTVYLPDQCSTYGTWDPATLTCTLAQDLTESVEITQNNVTLDCNTYGIRGITRFRSPGYGIYVNDKLGVTIKNCMVTRFNTGIYLRLSNSNNLLKNTTTDNYSGIFLWSSNMNNIEHNISNLNDYHGIYLKFSNNNGLVENSVSRTNLGIIIDSSHNNSLTKNSTFGHQAGISVIYAHTNIVTNNTISLNLYDGIFVSHSDGNIFSGNNISNSSYGIYLATSYNNKVYHNNFLDNYHEPQAIVYFYSVTGNLFDDGYPSGGNYWSDYTGADLYSGPNQDQPGSDGIGDTPYTLYIQDTYTGGQDRYPFMRESGWEAPPVSEWVKVSNTPYGIWRLRKTSGTENKPADDILKIVPNDWVLKLISKTDEDCQTVEPDEYIWWKVENPGNGVTGCMAAEKSNGSEKYLILGDQKWAEEVSSNARADEIVDAVNYYYTDVTTQSSLYSSNDGIYGQKAGGLVCGIENPQSCTETNADKNYIFYLQENGFPVDSILAIAATESGPGFDNEIYGTAEFDNGNLRTGGVGIMQITGEGNRGWGSAMKCYPDACHLAQNDGVPTQKYYTNTRQGIYANIKDGLRVLQYALQNVNFNDNYKDYCPSIGSEEVKKIGAVWKYNAGGVRDYLEQVGGETEGRLKTLGDYFPGYEPKLTFDELTQWSQKFTCANRNYEYIKFQSPGELRIYDSEGLVTGLVNGEVREDMPNSLYNEEEKLISILFPDPSYRYEVVGTTIGTYGLDIISVQNGNSITFTALDIPISPGVVHQYMIDWDKLSRGEKGVTLQIDADGDGVFEETVTADNDLTRDEFVLQTETVVDIDSDTINLKSKGQWLTAYIELPPGYEVAQIDAATVVLEGIPAETDPKYGFVTDPAQYLIDHDQDGILERMVKFNRSQIQALFLEATDVVDLVLWGKLLLNSSRVDFKGEDSIRVIDEGNLHQSNNPASVVE